MKPSDRSPRSGARGKGRRGKRDDPPPVPRPVRPVPRPAEPPAAGETRAALLRISQKLHATLDPDAVLDALVAEAILLIRAEGGISGLATPSGMVCRKYVRRTGTEPFDFCWPPGVGLAGFVLRRGAAYLTNDARADRQIVPEVRDKFSVRSALCTPIRTPGGEVIGFMELHNKIPETGFTESDRDLLAALSGVASLAVQNALAYRRLEAADESLRLAESKYRSIFENAVTGIFQSTPSGRFLTANPALARMFGYDSPGDLVKNVTDIGRQLYARPEERQRLSRIMLEKGAVQGVEIHLRRKDGSLFWVHSSARVVRDETGEISYFEGTTMDITGLKQAQDSMKRLSARVLRLQEEERRRIARELHDSTSQLLASLAMNLLTVEESAEDLSAKGREAVSRCLALTEECTREVRTLSYLLHPPFLDEAGLGEALRWYARGFADRSGIGVHLDLPDDLRRLPPDHERTLFRIVQEGLANIMRHSGSPTAEIRLTVEPSEVLLEVKDQGRGISTEQIESLFSNPGLGVGIVGMRERAEQIGGRLDLESSGRGVTVRVTLPLPVAVA